jgi:ribosomal protein S6
MSDTQTVYELAYVLRVGESDSALKAVLQKFGATIVKEQPAGQIQLAYPIKKQGVGLFGYLHLTVADSAAVKQISDALQLESSVLRFINVKIPATRKAKQSAERKLRGETPIAASDKPKSTAAAPSVDRLEGLSNEKLSKTLEEILK